MMVSIFYLLLEDYPFYSINQYVFIKRCNRCDFRVDGKNHQEKNNENKDKKDIDLKSIHSCSLEQYVDSEMSKLYDYTSTKNSHFCISFLESIDEIDTGYIQSINYYSMFCMVLIQSPKNCINEEENPDCSSMNSQVLVKVPFQHIYTSIYKSSLILLSENAFNLLFDIINRDSSPNQFKNVNQFDIILSPLLNSYIRLLFVRYLYILLFNNQIQGSFLLNHHVYLYSSSVIH